MSREGRLERGKLNYNLKKDLDNPETLEYVESLPKEVPKKVKKSGK